MNYRDTVTINGEEVKVVVSPMIIEANTLYSIDVFTSYFDPSTKITNYTPQEIKDAFESGIPVFYLYQDGGEEGGKSVTKGNVKSLVGDYYRIQLTSAEYNYNGSELYEMHLMDANGDTRINIHFYSSQPYVPVE